MNHRCIKIYIFIHIFQNNSQWAYAHFFSFIQYPPIMKTTKKLNKKVFLKISCHCPAKQHTAVDIFFPFPNNSSLVENLQQEKKETLFWLYSQNPVKNEESKNKKKSKNKHSTFKTLLPFYNVHYFLYFDNFFSVFHFILLFFFTL